MKMIAHLSKLRYVRDRLALKFDYCVFFYFILVDYHAQPYNLNQQHRTDFITAITQPCGPVEEAFGYLKTQANAHAAIL